MSGFDSLTKALEDWFNKPLRDLPEDMRKRIEQDFPPIPWDDLSADQRRSAAYQWDYQHDPATEQDREFWWDFFLRKSAIEKQIAEWEAVATPTAGDLAQKEKRVAELRQELARMERQQSQARGDTPQTEVNHKGHLNHDAEMQARANEIAAEQMAATNKSITRDKVAKILAKEREMDEATVLRRIRKQWK